MCRFIASLQLMPKDESTPRQNLLQRQGTQPFLGASYNYIYERQGNFTSPVLAIHGSQVGLGVSMCTGGRFGFGFEARLFRCLHHAVQTPQP